MWKTRAVDVLFVFDRQNYYSAVHLPLLRHFPFQVACFPSWSHVDLTPFPLLYFKKKECYRTWPPRPSQSVSWQGSVDKLTEDSELNAFFLLFQDCRDDVGGAQNVGMLGILVKTGMYLLHKPSLNQNCKIHSCLKNSLWRNDKAHWAL